MVAVIAVIAVMFDVLSSASDRCPREGGMQLPVTSATLRAGGDLERTVGGQE